MQDTCAPPIYRLGAELKMCRDLIDASHMNRHALQVALAKCWSSHG